MIKNRLGKLIRPEHLFAAGIIIIPSFIFQDVLPVKWLQVIFFILLSVLSGKRVRVLPNIIMTGGIVFANLLTPVGEVLFTAAGFPFTRGAVFNGLEKSALLIGMIYISRFSVSSGFVLHRRRENILSLVFYYFEKIMEGEKAFKDSKYLRSENMISHAESAGSNNTNRKKNQFNIDSFIERIDRKITAVYMSKDDFQSSNNVKSSGDEVIRKTETSGWIIIICIISLNWGLFLIN